MSTDTAQTLAIIALALTQLANLAINLWTRP